MFYGTSSTCFLSSSICTDTRCLLRLLLNIIISIALVSVLLLVVLFLVMVPLHFAEPLPSMRFCLSMIAASKAPFGDSSCGSFGMYLHPSLLLVSASIMTDAPARVAFSTSVSRAKKKGTFFFPQYFLVVHSH